MKRSKLEVPEKVFTSDPYWTDCFSRRNPDAATGGVLSKRNSQPAALFKERLWQKCFPVSFATFLRAPFFTPLGAFFYKSKDNIYLRFIIVINSDEISGNDFEMEDYFRT